MSEGKTSLREKITELRNGLPQDWLLIDRVISLDLLDPKSYGGKGPPSLRNLTVRQVFQQDLSKVIERKSALFRPLIGENGSGKTTHLLYVLKPLVTEIYGDNGFFLFFDFRYIADTEEEFWRAFFLKIYETVTDEGYLHRILGRIPTDKTRELRKIYGDNKIARQVLNAASDETAHQEEAADFFYRDEFMTETNVRRFYEGFLKLVFKYNFFIVIAFDELQHLSETCSEVLTKKILEKFVRATFERFRKNKLYFAFSCLQNDPKEFPPGNEYDTLLGISHSFADVVRNREIHLGKLKNEEFNEILNQSCQKANLTEKEAKEFISVITSNIDYYSKRNTPRELMKLLFEAFETIGILELTESEIRNLYEQKARDFMRSRLIEKGIPHVEPDAFKIGGIYFDIYAQGESQRTASSHIKKAFGEAKSVKCTKGLAEDFIRKLRDLKNREYKPSRDYCFLISPDKTPDAQMVLKDAGVEWISFNPPEIQEYFRRKKEEEKGKVSLRDIKGVGDKVEEQLRKSEIQTIEDLVNCNPKLVSESTKRFGRKISEPRIKKFQQIAKELLES